MRHVLVVANQTLGGRELLATLKDRAGKEPIGVFLLVPATLPADDHAMVSAGPAGGVTPGTRDSGRHFDAYEVAERQLEKGLSLIRGLTKSVEGEVGDDDPMHAIDEALRRRSFDEVIISTLPHRTSHWLRADLPARVQRKHHIPVTTVTAHG